MKGRTCGTREVFPHLARLRFAQERGGFFERVCCGGNARGTLRAREGLARHSGAV